MKKILTLLLAVVMALGVFSACGNQSGSEDTLPQSGGDNIHKPEIVGSLTVYAAAAVKIFYGADGLVLDVKGLNADGEAMIEGFENQYFGNSCTDAVNQLIKDCVQKNLMFETKYAAVKLDKDSALPGTSFLESIESATQRGLDAVESDATLVIINQENLTAEGYIDVVTAERLVRAYLGVDRLNFFDGPDHPVDGMYGFTVTYGMLTEKVIVNAETGAVSHGFIPEVELEMEQEEMEDFTEATKPEKNEDETVPTFTTA